MEAAVGGKLVSRQTTYGWCQRSARHLGTAQAFAAVAQVGTHGGAGRVGVLIADRHEDAFVLAINTQKVGEPTLRRGLRCIDPGSRDDHGPEVDHQIGEMLVVGGAGNLHMELEVGRNSV